MVTAITNGVKISVETVYQDEYSNPGNEHFMFAYRINIENLSDYAIQLNDVNGSFSIQMEPKRSRRRRGSRATADNGAWRRTFLCVRMSINDRYGQYEG